MDIEISNLLDAIESNISLNAYKLNTFATNYFNSLMEKLNTCDETTINEVLDRIEIIADSSEAEASILLYSMILIYRQDKKIITKILLCTFKNREILGCDNVFFIYQQALRLIFRYPETDYNEIFKLNHNLYKYCLSNYANLLQPECSPIPMQDRNEKFVLVITQQLVLHLHAPSRITLDTCKYLIDSGYKVLLIDTTEYLSSVHSLEFLYSSKASYINDYLEVDSLQWKGTDIPYFQCEENMPNYETIRQLLLLVRELKPAYAISIASGTIFEGLLAKLVPVLSIPMTYELTVSGENYQMYSGKKDAKYYERLNILGLTDDNILYSDHYGFSLLEQKETHTRSEINLSEDDFVMVLADGVLVDVLDENFFNCFKNILQSVPNAKLILIGPINSSELNMYLDDNIICLGYVNDYLSWLDICDLYINPKRRGGGTSCVEAMYKGLPIVTCNYGDIAVNAGFEFCVDDYDDYPETVKRYHDDKEFYGRMSLLAKERASKLLNAKELFLETFEKFKAKSNCLSDR